MNQLQLNELLTPRREDGGLDQRYIPIIKGLLNQCDERHLISLSKFWHKTNELENQHGGTALHLITKSYTLEVDEWERKRLNKSLREALKELGFKPAKVTMIMGAGEFLACKASDDEARNLFRHNPRIKTEGVGLLAAEIDKYHSKCSISLLYAFCRTNWTGRRKAFKHYLDSGELASKREAEQLQQSHPLNPNETRGRQSPYRTSTYHALPETPTEASVVVDVSHTVVNDLTALQPAADAAERSIEDMVIDFVSLTQSINWDAVQDSPELQEILAPVSNQMMLAAHLAIPRQLILQ